MTDQSRSLLERHDRLGDELGVELFLQRDDLLPFPLAGNKYRKLRAELAEERRGDVVLVTAGAIDSNHCRTLAFLAAARGQFVHLVLHGDSPPNTPALLMFDRLGARYDLVAPDAIGNQIQNLVTRYTIAGKPVRVVEGGCHTPSGAQAYRQIGAQVIAELQPDLVFVASGTGATQGGLTAAAIEADRPCRVAGISVARSGERGAESVREAATWVGGAPAAAAVTFLDQYRDGGYGKHSAATRSAVLRAWQHGLPLDTTYTGKAFRGMLDEIAAGAVAPGTRVLFWHTGGLWNALTDLSRHPRSASGNEMGQ